MLTVIENKKGGFFTQHIHQYFDDGSIICFPDAQNRSNRLWNQCRVRKRIERNEPYTAGIIIQKFLSHLQRKARLTNPTHTCESHKSILCNEICYLIYFFFTPDEG